MVDLGFISVLIYLFLYLKMYRKVFMFPVNHLPGPWGLRRLKEELFLVSHGLQLS